MKIKLNMPVTFYQDCSTGRYEVTFPKGWEFDGVIDTGISYNVPNFGPVTSREATVVGA